MGLTQIRPFGDFTQYLKQLTTILKFSIILLGTMPENQEAQIYLGGLMD